MNVAFFYEILEKRPVLKSLARFLCATDLRNSKTQRGITRGLIRQLLLCTRRNFQYNSNENDGHIRYDFSHWLFLAEVSSVRARVEWNYFSVQIRRTLIGISRFQNVLRHLQDFENVCRIFGYFQNWWNDSSIHFMNSIVSTAGRLIWNFNFGACLNFKTLIPGRIWNFKMGGLKL